MDFGNERWAVEVKLSASPGPDDMKKLDLAADMIRASKRFLVSQTSRPSGGEDRASLNMTGFMERLLDT